MFYNVMCITHVWPYHKINRVLRKHFFLNISYFPGFVLGIYLFGGVSLATRPQPQQFLWFLFTIKGFSPGFFFKINALWANVNNITASPYWCWELGLTLVWTLLILYLNNIWSLLHFRWSGKINWINFATLAK